MSLEIIIGLAGELLVAKNLLFMYRKSKNSWAYIGASSDAMLKNGRGGKRLIICVVQ